LLVELRIQNIALIDSLNLTLGDGLHVLTGETGAGKSIIIDAVSLLLGGRASSELIRSGSEQALVEGLFHFGPGCRAADRLGEMGIAADEDGYLLLAREMSRGGRSVGRVNGKVIPLGLYREVGGRLVDIHGQHEHQSLSNPGIHLNLLDAFGGGEIAVWAEQVRELNTRISRLAADREQFGGSEQERARRAEFLGFQVDEIDRARLVPGEEEQLREERLMLANAEKLREIAEKAYLNLFAGGRQESAYDMVSAGTRSLKEAENLLPAFGDLSRTVEGLLYQLEDIARELGIIKEKLEVDPARLAEVEERLQLIRQLQKKYGPSIEDILRYREEKNRELDEQMRSSEKIESIEKELAELRGRFHEAAQGLSDARRTAAGRLDGAVGRELSELGMAGTRFAVEFRLRDEPDGRGIDDVEFLLSANQGEPLKPLARVASGGELSRIMLALKSILAAEDQIPTLIFDEIDAGIGGRSLAAVARKLFTLSRGRQVVCVTHSPQIAGFADRHLAITKSVIDGRTRTDVSPLSDEECVAEIARMLGGEQNAATWEHARDILRQAGAVKCDQAGTGADF